MVFIQFITFGMYPKNWFKGQRILFVMPYSCEMNEKEKRAFSYKYLKEKYENKKDNECIQSSLDYTGIEVDYVINYKDAILKLTKSTQRNGYCDYFACAILSGRPYAELPNPDDDPYLLGQFLKVVKQFWINGGSLGIFADNAPFTYHANLLIEELFPEVIFRIGGNHKGKKHLNGDDSGLLNGPKTFNRKIQIKDNYSRVSISHSLYTLYEGETVSYICENPHDDNKLYSKEDGNVIPINDPEKLKPFVPFSRDSDGGYNSLFYGSNDKHGDIVIDCSYTKFFLEMNSSGIPRYIQNIIPWLANPEKHIREDGFQDGSEFKPIVVNYEINDNDKWNKFKPKPIKVKRIEEMKNLFAVDCSSSISNQSKYYTKIQELVNLYYKPNRGDKFYTWSTGYNLKTTAEMIQYIKDQRGSGGTDSSQIARLVYQEKLKNEKFEHLIIVTDGQVPQSRVDTSDNLVKQYGLKFDYVSSYLINLHDDANESVGCPYCRESPGTTYILFNNGTEKQLATLTQEDRNIFQNINNINNWNDFKLKYENLFRAIRAECLGKERNQTITNDLNALEKRISDSVTDINDFKEKIKKLKELNGGLRTFSGSTVA